MGGVSVDNPIIRSIMLCKEAIDERLTSLASLLGKPEAAPRSLHQLGRSLACRNRFSRPKLLISSYGMFLMDSLTRRYCPVHAVAARLNTCRMSELLKR